MWFGGYPGCPVRHGKCGKLFTLPSNDTLMMHFDTQGEDGSLFRVDFGFVFGATPEIDSPQTVVARAITYALGDRWLEVVAACVLAGLKQKTDQKDSKRGNSWGNPSHLWCLQLRSCPWF